MALTRRAHAAPKVAVAGALALVVVLLLVSFVSVAWRPSHLLARFPEPAFEPCEKQPWVNADRACLTWTAPRAGVNGPIHNVVEKGASRSVVTD
jgi:hypothetical protein